MELLIRGMICTICIWVYNHILLNKKRKKSLEVRIEVPFVILTAFALQIITNSAIYRISNVTHINIWMQEILLVVGVLIEYTILRILGNRLLSEGIEKWMYNVVSITVMIGILLYTIRGDFTREEYIIEYSLAVLVSLVMCIYRAESICISKSSVWKNRLKFSVPAAVFVGSTFYIYLPSELYLGNPYNFLVEYGEFIYPLIVKFLLYISVYLVGTLFFMTKKHYYICNILSIIFVFLSNMQNMFFNGELKSIDGTMQVWETHTLAGNLILWLFVLCGIFVIAIRNKKIAKDILKITAYAGVAIQSVALIILLVVTLPNIKFDNYILTTDDYFEVSDNKNVFVFILDWFDAQIMEDIVNENEEFLEPLDGFVHYVNTTSKYAFTDMSLVYLLTGVEWEYDQSEKEYAVKAHENSDVLEKMADQGYTIEIYTDGSYIGDGERTLVENGCFVERSLKIDEQIPLMEKMTRYKTSPFIFKDRFLYSDDDVWGMIIVDGDKEIHNINRDIRFAEILSEKGIVLNENTSGMFKVYHLHGAHAPYNMNEQFERIDTDMITQSKAGMKLVYTFIEQLKENGLYEDSTIIITADHGQNYFDRPTVAAEMGLTLISSPILFVKESGSYGKELQISTAPVSHEEIIPTVLEVITGDTQGYGRTLNEVQTDEKRIREFIYGRHSDIPFVRYEITGNVMDLGNWSEPIEYEKLSGNTE